MGQTAHNRITTRFQMFDANANGYLESDDFDQLADRIIDGLEADRGSPKAQAVRDGYRTYWEGLVAGLDADNDGRVSLDEFSAAVHDEAWYNRYAKPFAQAVASISDIDDDDQIDEAELTACLRSVGFPAEGVNALFAKLDPQGQGHISTSTLEGMIHDFYVSDDENVAGSLLVE